jgi:cAMP-dependent protein kinase regulator
MFSPQFKALKKSLQQRREDERQFLLRSPLERTTISVKRQLEIAVLYRMEILKKLKVFEKMNLEELMNVAQNMEELTIYKGECIIRQDDIGDALYIIEEGSVIITEKQNPRDPDEIPRVLATVGKSSLFGERSLITREPRSATVTVSSDVAKVLRMTKESFDVMIETSNKITGATRETIARDVVKRIPLLKNFSTFDREEVFKAMTHVSFVHGNYVFRQGAVGNHFYIITEGLLAVTITNDKGVEREVGRLHPGDYFGELALLGASAKRTANVFVLENSNLMCLSRADFGRFLGNLKDEMLQVSCMRITTVTMCITTVWLISCMIL